jgi:hypothetical protein
MVEQLHKVWGDRRIEIRPGGRRQREHEETLWSGSRRRPVVSGGLRRGAARKHGDKRERDAESRQRPPGAA